MKNLANIAFVLFMMLALLLSCSKKEDLPELGYNRWVEQVPNPIQLDSIRIIALDSLNAEVKVYLRFDRLSFEAEWDDVAEVRIAFYPVLPTDEPSLTSIAELTLTGEGTAERRDLRTETSYEMRYQIELENGRASVWSRSFTIDTPSF